MSQSSIFEFGDVSGAVGDDAFVATVPAGVTDTQQLFVALTRALLLPDYWGFNWNALSDCLRDFHWVRQRRVVLLHQELPAIGRDDLIMYLDVLAEAASSWQPGEDHRLVIVFPTQSRSAVLSAMKSHP